MSNATPVDGEQIRIGGRDFILAPLNFRAMRRISKEALANISSTDLEKKFDAFIAIVHASLLRNHPDVTTDELEDLLDVRNASAVVFAILRASGVTETAPGGAQPESPLTGMSSIGESSAPSPDGVGSTSTST